MVDAYLAEIDEARARHPQIEFVTGTEMDYLGALEDRQLTEDALAPFRFRLLSVHFIDGWAFDDPDQKARWKEPGRRTPSGGATASCGARRHRMRACPTTP